MVLKSLFFLPIHRRTYERYCQDHDKWVEKQKRQIDKSYGQSFDTLDDTTINRWKERWLCPQWRFNDIVGYLDIGMYVGNSLAADIFLKRKCFPKTARQRTIGGLTPSQKNDILFYRETIRVEVDVKKNESFVIALEDILDNAERFIKKRNCTFRLWYPPFDFSCINFVEVVKNLNQKGGES